MREETGDYADEYLPEGAAARSGVDEEMIGMQRPKLRRRGRADVRDGETLKQLVRDLPHFVKLLWGVARDPRVSRIDKAIVLATLGYLLLPIDIIPDALPVIGHIDDIYLVALALDRLLHNAGVDVLLDHWSGDVASLELALAALDKAGSFLPEPVRGLLYRRLG